MMSLLIAASGIADRTSARDLVSTGPGGAAHRLEDPIGARLQGHVQLRHDGRRSPAMASMTSAVNAARVRADVKRTRSRPVDRRQQARSSLPKA